METAAISHRVADFLKKHPPFHAMEEGDLLDLARQGRVRFFEENEYIVWQGEPYRTTGVRDSARQCFAVGRSGYRSRRCATFVGPGTCSALNS